MTCGLPKIADNLSSRRTLGGGGNLDMPGGSRGANTHAKLFSANDGGHSVGERGPRLLSESQPAEQSLVGESPTRHSRTRLTTHAKFLPSQRLTSGAAAANSRAQQRELSIDLREFATGLFLFGFVALVAVLLCIGIFGYRALVA